MVVLTVGFVLGDQGYPYITFESEDDINIGDHFSVRGDNYTFYFKASKLEVLGDKLLVTAREVGKRNGVDLRGAIGGEVKIINDGEMTTAINN